MFVSTPIQLGGTATALCLPPQDAGFGPFIGYSRNPSISTYNFITTSVQYDSQTRSRSPRRIKFAITRSTSRNIGNGLRQTYLSTYFYRLTTHFCSSRAKLENNLEPLKEFHLWNWYVYTADITINFHSPQPMWSYLQVELEEIMTSKIQGM